MEENKEILEKVEIEEEEPKAEIETKSKKDVDVKALVDTIFNKKDEENGEGDVKRPVNIFSKPIPVTQDETARRQRLKVVIIEAVLFGAFLTAITALYSISGIELKFDPDSATQDVSYKFFVLEFIFYTIVVGVGDYFLTEKRVNDYNAKMAGINVNIDEEIANALAEQEADGISAEDAAAQNKANGEEEKKAFIEVNCVKGEDSLADKAYEAFMDGTRVGTLTTEKGVVKDANGFENVVLKVASLVVSNCDFKNGIAVELINAAKSAAADNSLAAVVIPKSAYAELDTLNISDCEKFKITYKEALKIQEAYPGALMGVTGELN